MCLAHGMPAFLALYAFSYSPHAASQVDCPNCQDCFGPTHARNCVRALQLPPAYKAIRSGHCGTTRYDLFPLPPAMPLPWQYELSGDTVISEGLPSFEDPCAPVPPAVPYCAIGLETGSWYPDDTTPGVETPDGFQKVFQKRTDVIGINVHNGTNFCSIEEQQHVSVKKHTPIVCPVGTKGLNTNSGPLLCYTPRRAVPEEGCKGPCTKIGNPIHLDSGRKTQTEVDFTAGDSFPLTIARYYSSDGFPGGPGLMLNDRQMGPYWRHHYQRHISVFTTVQGTIASATRHDGTVRYFTLVGSNYVADADSLSQLVRLVDGASSTTGWRLTLGNNDVETYNADGRLIEIRKLGGLKHTVSYDLQGRVDKVTDSFGKSLTFGYGTSPAYSPEERLASISDPKGNLYQYTYDGKGNLTSVLYPSEVDPEIDDAFREYLYAMPVDPHKKALPNALTGIVDENLAAFATFDYDPMTGMAISTEHAGGVNRYSSPKTGNIDGPDSYEITDPLGTKRTYTFASLSGASRLQSISQPCSKPNCTGTVSETFTYDSRGNVASKIDFGGNRTNYVFNVRNLEETRTEGLTAAGATTAATRTITTEWDNSFRLPKIVTEPGRVTTLGYDGNGNLASKVVKDTQTEEARTWTWTHDAFGRVETATDPRDKVTTFVFYPNDSSQGRKRGMLYTVTNALQQVTIFNDYDGNGRLLQVTDANGVATSMTHTSRGWLSSRTTANETTVYSFDRVGQLKKVTQPDGSQIEYEFDAAHRLRKIKDSFGNSITYTVDAMGNRTAEDVKDNLGVLRQTHRREIDAMNRLKKDIGALSQATLNTFDDNGNLLSATDPMGKISSNEFDSLNRLSNVTDPGMGVTEYGYNALDQLITIKDPRSNTTTYTIDALGNVNKLESPDTGTTINKFDAAGNIEWSKDARLVKTNFEFDDLNRVKKIFWDGQAADTILFTYDIGINGIGRLTGMLDASGTTAWTFDQLGRVTSRIQTHAGSGRSFTTGYAWTAGRLTELTYPSGAKVAYEYSNGRIYSIKLKGQGGAADTPIVTSVAYHPFGAVNAWTWGNGSAYSRSFDTDGSLWSFPLGTTAKEVAFDLASRISGISETDISKNLAFGYDSLDRLTSQTVGAGGNSSLNQTLAYDPVGNRTSHTAGAATRTYATQATSNRLMSVSGLKSNSFDAAGNITSDGQQTWTYDNRARMKTHSGAAGVTTYSVNGLGQRVQKASSALTTHFAFDESGRLLGEYGLEGIINREHVWLEDLPVATLSDAATIEDFNADRSPDIVLRSTVSGDTWAWLLNPDLTLKSDALMAGVDTAWDLVAVADFNGDGKLDLLWRSSVSGAAYVWTMNGTSFVSDAFLFSVDAVWKVAAVADMNGDGKPDVVLRHKTTGATWVWYFNGTQFLSDAYLFTEDPVWKIVGAADFDLDGKTDLVLEHATNGSSFVRYLNGVQVVGDQPLFNIDPAWRISRVADMNRDGRPDIVYRHTVSGIAYAWYLEDRTFLGDALLMNVDPVWQQQSVQEGLQKALSTSSRPVNRPLPQGFAKPRPDKTPPAVRPAPRLESAQARLQPVKPSDFRGQIPPGPATPTKPAGKAQAKVAATRIQIHYVFADQIGSPRAITRPSDNVVVWRWDNIDPFGNNAANENPGGLGTFSYNLRFPGQYFDVESGTHYNYFRDYDPSTGRYVESDPIGLRGGVNTYGYVEANPLLRVDPYGDTGVLAGGRLGAGIGASIGSLFPGPGSAIGAALGFGIGAGATYFICKQVDEKDKAICDRQYEDDLDKCDDKYGNGLRGPGFRSAWKGCKDHAARRRDACYKGEADPGPWSDGRGGPGWSPRGR
jgi:RHS repeat-associated protein